MNEQSDNTKIQLTNMNVSEEPVPNRDMFLSEEILGLFPRLKPIIHNAVVEDFFASQEAIAVKKKKRFVKWGSICLVFVCLLLILVSWRLSLAQLSVPFPPIVDYIAAGLGIIALVIQICLSIFRTHSKWLYARFAAECTRLWKYQNFLDGKLMSLLEESTEEFNEELQSRWVLFSERFKAGKGGMRNFIESSPFDLFVSQSIYSSPIIFEDARRAYQLFRIDVQTAHLAYKNESLKSIDSWTVAAARISLLLSGLVAISDACLMGATALGAINSTREWATFAAISASSALSLAVISAGVRVYRSASSITEERERYRFKQLHLQRIDDQMKPLKDQSQVLALMERVEAICTEELQEFLRLLSHADYFH